MRPAAGFGLNAGDIEPLGIAQIAQMAAQTGGPIAGHHEVNAAGAGVRMCEVPMAPPVLRQAIEEAKT